MEFRHGREASLARIWGDMTQADRSPALIDLEWPETWPKPLLEFLDAHHGLFLGWETRGGETVSSESNDRAIYALSEILRSYAIRGWH